ncbi:tetratricopeptide repeat protein [Candidatus Poseidonia alphae]|nr:tetratricopeptide repeat protein [Candidatus Poseidonia alphae]MDA9168266.1 tetratricopeptide repeat protein [Candidatus Poseidonia alphae]
MTDEEASEKTSDVSEADDLADAVLSSVEDAIMAVENDEQPEELPVEKPIKKASNIIPEIDDVEDPEEMVQILLTVGEERSRNDDIKGALAAFNKAIALDPSCDMAWFNRGVLLEAQQDARGARQSFQICLDLNERHAPATANMAILLERIGDLEGAFSMAQKALEFFPGHPALVELSQRSKDSGLSVPIEVMEPSVEVKQDFDMKTVEAIAEKAGIDNPEELLQEAVHHDHDDDDQLSIEELESAADVIVAQQEVVKETPPVQVPTPVVPEPIQEEQELDIEVLVGEATEMLKSGDAKGALSLLKPHLKTIGARHPGAWRIAGGAMARLDLDNHAIAAMTHSQNLEPDHAPGWFNLGSVQQRSNLQSDAMASYKKALEADSTYVKAAEKLNILAKENGFIETFLESSRNLLSMEPNHAIKEEFIDMLIQLAVGENEVLDQVTGLPPTLPAGPEMAREALSHMSEEPTAHRALALSLNLQHGDSVLVWKALIQKDSQNGSNWRGLARALEQAGDLDTAQKCHAKANGLDGIVQQPATIVAPAPEPVSAMPQPEPALQPTQVEPVPIAEKQYAALPLETTPVQPSVEPVLQPTAANDLLMTPREAQVAPQSVEYNQQVDLAKAALDATTAAAQNIPQSTTSNAISNQDVAWFNQGVQLIDDGKYREALSCFDKALPTFAGDDAMIIRILNNRGNAYYFLEEYPKCVESYHQAMLIRPTEVRGETLYNMGTAYAEMERYNDAVKCFQQAIPRGLDIAATKRAKDQIRRCNILQKAVDKKRKKR